MKSNNPNLGTAAMSLVSGLMDESILVREARRWKTQKRWQMLLVIFFICGIYALPVMINLATSAQSGEPSPLFGAFGTFVSAVTLCSCVAAFYYSMQVLRHELWTQTLDGLFLTLQKDRGVILSIIACGAIAGFAPLLLCLPLIVFTSAAVSVPTVQVIAAIAVMVASVMASAALGTLWFFVGQRLFEVRVKPLWVALGTAVVLGALCLEGFRNGTFHRLELMVPTIFWTLILCAFTGLVVGSAWSVLREVRGRRTLLQTVQDRRAFLPLLIAGFLLLFLGDAVRNIFRVGFIVYAYVTSPISNIVTLMPSTAAAHLLSGPLLGGLNAGFFWSEGGPAIAAVLCAFLTLLAMGITATSCGLYRRLRESPERADVSRERLQVADVGCDDWHGFRNPILNRELRTRLRNGDARLFIAVAALLSAAACLIPLFSSLGGVIRATQIADLARTSFIAVSVVQMAIACLIGPGIGAEVVAAEKEKKTFEMLVASRLTAHEILVGKMQGCMALLLLLLSPSFPLLALTAFLHGVTAWMVLGIMAVLVFFIFVLSVVCVSISALAHSSVTGKWVAYVASGLLFAAFSWIPVSLPTLSGAEGFSGVGVLFLASCFLLLWIPAVERIRVAGRGKMNPSALRYPARINADRRMVR